MNKIRRSIAAVGVAAGLLFASAVPAQAASTSFWVGNECCSLFATKWSVTAYRPSYGSTTVFAQKYLAWNSPPNDAAVYIRFYDGFGYLMCSKTLYQVGSVTGNVTCGRPVYRVVIKIDVNFDGYGPVSRTLYP